MDNNKKNIELLIVGSIGLDDIETPFIKKQMVLGGSASYASVAASFFCQPGMVAVIGEDFTQEHKNIFLNRDVNLEGLKALPGKTFRWGGKYSFDLNNRQTTFTELNVLQQFNPLLPESYKAAGFVFLGNIDPKLQLQVLGQLENPKLVAMDTMNYWIEKAGGNLQKMLTQTDLLIINDAEARQLTGEFNVYKAAGKILATMQTKKRALEPTLVIKRGEYGLVMFQAKQIFFLPAYPLENVFDPTGAGDSFAGAFLGYLSSAKNLSWESLKHACLAGSVVASFCVEKIGLEGLLEINTEKIEHRLKQLKQMTEFENI